MSGMQSRVFNRDGISLRGVRRAGLYRVRAERISGNILSGLR
jgi:hypothetical protein